MNKKKLFLSLAVFCLPCCFNSLAIVDNSLTVEKFLTNVIANVQPANYDKVAAQYAEELNILSWLLRGINIKENVYSHDLRGIRQVFSPDVRRVLLEKLKEKGFLAENFENANYIAATRQMEESLRKKPEFKNDLAKIKWLLSWVGVPQLSEEDKKALSFNAQILRQLTLWDVSEIDIHKWNITKDVRDNFGALLRVFNIPGYDVSNLPNNDNGRSVLIDILNLIKQKIYDRLKLQKSTN